MWRLYDVELCTEILIRRKERIWKEAGGCVFKGTIPERLRTTVKTSVRIVGDPADTRTGCVNFKVVLLLHTDFSIIWRIIHICLRFSRTHFNLFPALHSPPLSSAVYVLSGCSVTSVLEAAIKYSSESHN